jgi:hypothetical protein
LRNLSKVALAAASSVAALALAAPAQASPMDITPDRLYLNPPGLPAGWNCQSIAANPNGFAKAHPLPKGATDVPACLPDNAGWANLMSELGYAIAPSAFHPARTTGFGGFSLSLEASYAHINADAVDSNGVQYWHQGTQGSTQPNGSFGTSNSSPDSVLQVYTLKARKGLPFGFEITGALGYVANTTMWVGGADIHWALLEGYRTGVLGYIPDLSIGGGVRTMSGQSSFYLTTVGIDATASKPIPLADSAVLTPYIGAQRLIIYANSTDVNLTPNADALAVCGYGGINPTTGGPVCHNGTYGNADFNNLNVFQKQTFYRWRGLAGLTYRYELLYLAGQFAMDMEDPGAENSNLSGAFLSNQSVSVTGARQWTLSLEAGVFF